MKKTLKIILIVAVVAFAGIQFIRPNISAAPAAPGDALEASMQVPDQVEAIFNRSCADCHTNNTVLPWYSQVAPVSWWLGNHISDGRRHLNLSIWNTYNSKRKVDKLKEICDQVETGEMPLPSYLWVHRYAVMKEGEAKILCDWSNAEASKISSAQPAN